MLDNRRVQYCDGNRRDARDKRRESIERYYSFHLVGKNTN
jgi:hypothetical protein